MLVAACRTQDEILRLERALAKAKPIVEGSKGQARPHPLYAEVRAHRLVFKQLLAAVGLEEGESQYGTARSSAGRRLARQRWGQRGAA
jgi:hypothetical protein